MKLLSAVLALALLPHGCQTVTTPPPANVPSEPRLEAVVGSRESKISANAEAADLANSHNPEGAPKSATAGALSVVRSLAGPATEKDRLDAQKLVNAALNGKLADAQAGWNAEKANSTLLNAEITKLKSDVENEKVRAAEELKAQLLAAKNEANAARNKIIAWVTMGFGGLALFAGVIILVMGEQYPFLGPRAGFAALAGGFTLIGTGIAINAIERAIEDHPYIISGGLAVALASIGISCALTFSNHYHAKLDSQPSK